MSDPTPEATVVVATRDRAPRLGALLASLAAQRDVTFEVVVVDDGSTDGTAAVLRGAAAKLDLRTIRLERPRGPAIARNAGWRAARAPLVAITDDDCVAGPGWLAALAAAHRRRPEALIQGRTEPNPDELHRLSAFSRSLLVERLDPYFPTCNMAYPRDLLERVGGFDESFRRLSGEDTDLAWRAREAGAPAVFCAGARVLHAVHPVGALALVRESQRWVDTVRVVKRHPGLRTEYLHRVFWKPSHERLVAAAAGLLLARRTRGAGLALALPYVALHRHMHRSWAGTLAAMPGHVAVDGAEVIAVLRGSLRYRTLVI